MEQTKGSLMAFLKSEKGSKALLIAGILAIALIFISNLIPKKTDNAEPENTQTLMAADEYAAQLEEKLSDIVGSIAGAGECKVMVTLENGVEYVYAQEEKSSGNKTEDSVNGATTRTQESDDSQKSYIIVDSGSGKQALVVTEVQPKIKGVVVVCKGGGNAAVQQRVIEAVTTALSVNSTKVCVTQLS